MKVEERTRGTTDTGNGHRGESESKYSSDCCGSPRRRAASDCSHRIMSVQLLAALTAVAVFVSAQPLRVLQPRVPRITRSTVDCGSLIIAPTARCSFLVVYERADEGIVPVSDLMMVSDMCAWSPEPCSDLCVLRNDESCLLSGMWPPYGYACTYWGTISAPSAVQMKYATYTVSLVRKERRLASGFLIKPPVLLAQGQVTSLLVAPLRSVVALCTVLSLCAMWLLA